MNRLDGMPGIRAVSSALAVAACAAALAACGGDDEGGTIPEDQGNDLLGLLDQVESQVNEGLCDDAEQTAVTFAERVSQLPSEVDSELRNALVEASGSLESLTEQQCEPPTGASDDTTTVPPETETTSTTTTTTTDETTTTEEPPPEDEGDDDGGGPPVDTPGNGNPGGGNGNGNGNGGDDGGFSGGIGSGG